MLGKMLENARCSATKDEATRARERESARARYREQHSSSCDISIVRDADVRQVKHCFSLCQAKLVPS